MTVTRFTDKRGVSKIGTRQKTINKELFDRVRKTTNKTKEELPDKDIKKAVILGNKEIAKWVVENPEGFQVYKDMGYIVPSKYLPKEFRTDKEEKIQLIKDLDISEAVRLRFLKRYDIDIGNRLDMHKLATLKEQIPLLNLHSFFYIYRIMWFNKRNCNFYKAKAYIFKPIAKVRKELYNQIMSGKDYYEWNFHDFYGFLVSPNEVKPKRVWNNKKDKEINTTNG